MNPISDEQRREIELCAYHIWEREGRPQGREHIHWLMAEAEILGAASPKKTKSTAKSAKRKTTGGTAAAKPEKSAATAKAAPVEKPKAKRAAKPKAGKPANKPAK